MDIKNTIRRYKSEMIRSTVYFLAGGLFATVTYLEEPWIKHLQPFNRLPKNYQMEKGYANPEKLKIYLRDFNENGKNELIFEYKGIPCFLGEPSEKNLLFVCVPNEKGELSFPNPKPKIKPKPTPDANKYWTLTDFILKEKKTGKEYWFPDNITFNMKKLKKKYTLEKKYPEPLDKHYGNDKGFELHNDESSQPQNKEVQ